MAKREKRTYYWIVGYKSDGVPLVTLGGETQREAELAGYDGFQATTYEIIGLPTRSQQEATSMIKRQKLMTKGNPDEAMRRTSHIPEKKERIEYY